MVLLITVAGKMSKVEHKFGKSWKKIGFHGDLIKAEAENYRKILFR